MDPGTDPLFLSMIFHQSGLYLCLGMNTNGVFSASSSLLARGFFDLFICC